MGLDHNTDGFNEDDPPKEDLAPGFSASALRYVKQVILKEDDDEEDEEDNLLDEDDLKDALGNIEEEVKSEEEEEVNFDRPLYRQLPKSDEEYTAVLLERFGHESFKEGQLEAIKILLEKKQNAMVVLATGGGKSLIYQYVSMFVGGLVLLITPLISLMTDQL